MPIPTDATVVADETGFEVARVGDGLEGLWEGPGRGSIEVGGYGAVEGLVGPDVVELSHEVAERTLLSTHVGTRWPGGTALEHEVHVLVPAVLLGRGGLDELGQDLELDEPDGEPGEASEGVGGEGSAIVGSDAVGKPELAEEPSEHRDYAIDGDIRAAVAGEQEARVHVLDGERVAEVTIAGRELALEVRAPALVGRIGRGVGPTGVPASDTPAALGDEIVPAQDVMDGGPRGQVELGAMPLQKPADLLGPVVVVGPSQIEDRLDN